MQNLKILNSKEVKNIRNLLKEQFGVEERLEFVYLMNSEGRVYVVNRDIENVELEKLRIDVMGLYFGTIANDGLRLSIEGSQIVGPKAKKSILELNDEQFYDWLKGKNLEVDEKLKGIYIVKHKEEFVGSGVAKKGNFINHLPKSRRLVVVND